MVTAAVTATGVGIHNVLIATDLSHSSSDILRLGIDVCQSYGTHAFLIYVLPRDEFMLAGFEAYAAARDAARRDLFELEEQLRSQYEWEQGKHYELLMSEGDIADRILDCAREKHIDLIVLGTHGRKGLTKAIIGSVAERVFRHSEVPVLTLGPSAHGSFASGPKRIVAPIDFTPASQSAARYACALARDKHAELLLINVIDHAPGGAMADMECLKRGVEERLTELVRDDMDPGRLRVIAEFGKVVPSILDAVWNTKADLMVLGVHNYPGLLDHFRWQTAYDLVRQSSCPVLTIREPSSAART